MKSSTTPFPLISPRLARIGTAIIIILLCFSLGRTIWFSYKTQQGIARQEKEVQLLEEKVFALEQKVQEATASHVLEKRARDELGLQKEGEHVFKIKK